MNFEEYFKKKIKCSFEEYCMDYYARQFAHLIEEAWEDQQKIIDFLKSELEDIANGRRFGAERSDAALALEELKEMILQGK